MRKRKFFRSNHPDSNSEQDSEQDKMIPVREKTFRERHNITPLRIIKWIVSIFAVFLVFGVVWMSLFSKQAEKSFIRAKIGKNIGAFQEIGKISDHQTVYTGNKSGKGYVWVYDVDKKEISQPEDILMNHDEKISYLTQIQLTQNLGSKYKLTKDQSGIIYKGKQYSPIYEFATDANAEKLVPVRGSGKESKNNKKTDKVKPIKLKHANLYLSDKQAQSAIKKKYGFDTKKMVLTEVQAGKDGHIDYYVLSVPKIRPFRISIDKNGTVSIAKGHYTGAADR